MKESHKTFTTELIVAIASLLLCILIFTQYTGYQKEQRSSKRESIHQKQ